MVLYSHSRLSTFESCPLKYKFHYVDKVRTESTSSVEAFMGGLVHESLEWLYKRVKFGRVPELKELIKVLKESWQKNWNSGIIIVSKDLSCDDYLSLAVKMVTEYYNKYYPFNDSTIISLEERVIIKLDKLGKYKLVGFIDRLSCVNDNEYHIVDYKTNSHLKLQEQLDSDRQLALYQIAVLDNYSDARKVVLNWHFLAFNKLLTSTRTREQLEGLKKDTIDLIKSIEKEKLFKPNVTKLCDWCEYRSICPEWSHLAKLEAKSVNEYLKDDGVQLVNQYVRLSNEKREVLRPIDDNLEKIKKALVIFAKKNKLGVVFGSDNKITIKIEDSYKFPEKGSKEREKLEAFLKKVKKWDSVAVLDTHALNRVVKEGLWDKTIIKKLTDFAQKDETSRLYTGKMKKEGVESLFLLF